MPPEPDTDRQDAILDAAFGVFAAYGYRRTAMDDIARACGLSRSALYLHFRNKEDIFRSLTLRHLDQSMAAMETALNRPGQTVEEALYAAFQAKDGPLMEMVLATPHGAELIDAGFSSSPDLVKAAADRAGQVLAAWAGRRGLPPELGPPEDLAATVIAALMGLKTGVRSIEELRAGQRRLARLVARALA